MLAYDRIRRMDAKQLEAAQRAALPSRPSGPAQTKAQAQAILQAALGRKK